MDYTQNYHLPQWVKSDRIMMDDFNDAMNRLESGLTNAQATADSARSAASSASATASSAYSAANTRPYATGSYTGTGADQSIYLGFRPRFVIISGTTEAADFTTLTYFSKYSCASGPLTIVKSLEITSSGFTVHFNRTRSPMLSEDGRVYEYIAFK